MTPTAIALSAGDGLGEAFEILGGDGEDFFRGSKMRWLLNQPPSFELPFLACIHYQGIYLSGKLVFAT